MTHPVEDRSHHEDEAPAYFAALDIALSRGNYAAAAKAQRALAELGWDIRHRHQTRQRPRPKAATAGVDQ
jgi:hypothetical protein